MRLAAFFAEPIPRAVFALAALVLPFAGAACGRTACFQWTVAEGACPAQEDAIPLFRNPVCPGTVATVDSEGTFDGEFCCYSVTQVNVTTEFFGGSCQGFGGFNNSGTSVGNGSGVEEPPSPGPACFSCLDVLLNASSIPPSELCQASAKAFDALLSCACDDVEGCAADCAENFCSATDFTSTCGQCMEMVCPAEFNTCGNAD